LVGKGLALEMFVAAEKLGAPQALAVGLIDALAEDPVAEAVRHIQQLRTGPHIAQNGPIARVSPAVIP
jgi:enoyl-CoA hydratase/carnithine racemase